MSESRNLFSLNWEQFHNIWNSWIENDCGSLQHEFKTRNILLSDSLLKWENSDGELSRYFADFENGKTYDIYETTNGDPEKFRAEIWERGDEKIQPVTSNDPEYIFPHLQSAIGTHLGFIDLLLRLCDELNQIDLDELKRPDLSGAGFGFQRAQGFLSVVYARLQEILSCPRESLRSLPWSEIVIVKGYALEFYENVQKILSFSPAGENPTEAHTSLQRDIISWCDGAGTSLNNITSFLSSRKLHQIGEEAQKEINNLSNKLNEIIERFEENEKARQKRFNDLEIAMENKVAGNQISNSKEIFQKQAAKHKKHSRFWLTMTLVATGVFILGFFLLPILVKSEGTGLTNSLQNLFMRGLLLSPIYVWLNRSIKNHTAQKHLEIINTHRQNALETFEVFVTAAGENRETRDAVLLAATEAIFDANQTGYLSTKTSATDSRNPMLAIIREIVSRKSAPRDS